MRLLVKIINQSKQLTTVSIPSGLTCEHSFQAFVDKNFVVRGYQTVDFEFSKMELYESSIDVLEEKRDSDVEEKDFTSMTIFQNIVKSP